MVALDLHFDPEHYPTRRFLELGRGWLLLLIPSTERLNLF
jgi:hypothetical protein